MLPDIYITYNYRIDSDVRTASNGNFLTLLYNSLIYHRNIYTAILMITISYVHIRREEYFLSNIQSIGNRYPASLTNFGALANFHCPPPTRFGHKAVPLRNLPRIYGVFLLNCNACQCKRSVQQSHQIFLLESIQEFL